MGSHIITKQKSIKIFKISLSIFLDIYQNMKTFKLSISVFVILAVATAESLAAPGDCSEWSGDSARKVVALGLERGFVKIQLVPQKGRISRKQKNAKHGTTIVNPFQKCFKLLSNHSIHSKLQSNFSEKLMQKTAVILTLVKTEEFVKMELTPTLYL